MTLTTTIAAGAKGADFTVDSPAIDAWLDQQHARFVIRYIVGGGAWKHITPDEIAHHHSRGVAIVLNYEGSTGDYTGGATRGKINGTAARALAKQYGYPPGLPLVVSVDTGLTASQLPMAKAYVTAFWAAALPYTPGLYGPVNLYHKVRDAAPLYWMPNASSWQIGLSPTDVVHVRQLRQLTPPGIDPNICETPFAAWLPTPDPIPPPPIAPVIGASGVRMLYCYLDANGTVWIGNGLARLALSSMDTFAQYVALSSSGGGPQLVTGSGVQVRGIGDVVTVATSTLEALGKPI